MEIVQKFPKLSFYNIYGRSLHWEHVVTVRGKALTFLTSSGQTRRLWFYARVQKVVSLNSSYGCTLSKVLNFPFYSQLYNLIKPSSEYMNAYFKILPGITSDGEEAYMKIFRLNCVCFAARVL